MRDFTPEILSRIRESHRPPIRRIKPAICHVPYPFATSHPQTRQVYIPSRVAEAQNFQRVEDMRARLSPASSLVRVSVVVFPQVVDLADEFMVVWRVGRAPVPENIPRALEVSKHGRGFEAEDIFCDSVRSPSQPFGRAWCVKAGHGV